MDLLTDLLQQAGLRRRLLDARHLSASTALRFPCEKSIGVHVVMRGTVNLQSPSAKAPIVLDAGDIALMARGCDHVLGAGPKPLARIETVAAPWIESNTAPLPDDAAYVVISGAYQLWNPPLHPFFRQMPEWFVLRASEQPRMGPLGLAIALLDEEVRRRELGASTVLHALLDVVFTYLLREIVAREGGHAAGFAQAVRDVSVRQAVTLMHDDPAAAWTLDELAQRVGVSRTSLAERFRAAMGDTPLAYLRTVRMQKAMRLLSETNRHLEAVATEVGYQDAFSFSKVFKRTVGVAPKEFRRRDAADRELPWRVGAG